jgi:peptidoglycan hydrolase-like protein with peptidoglycan-binding domain
MNSGPLLNTGAHGNDVRRLQRLLVMLKYLDYTKITGIYDAITKLRVKDYQTDHALTPDGITGPNTWASLPADPDTPVLMMGSHGPAVKAIQEVFKRISPPCPDPGTIDGVFGHHTSDAVKYYQTDIHQVPDGVVGDKTWWAPAGAAGATLAALAGRTTV